MSAEQHMHSAQRLAVLVSVGRGILHRNAMVGMEKYLE